MNTHPGYAGSLPRVNPSVSLPTRCSPPLPALFGHFSLTVVVAFRIGPVSGPWYRPQIGRRNFRFRRLSPDGLLVFFELCCIRVPDDLLYQHRPSVGDRGTNSNSISHYVVYHLNQPGRISSLWFDCRASPGASWGQEFAASPKRPDPRVRTESGFGTPGLPSVVCRSGRGGSVQGEARPKVLYLGMPELPLDRRPLELPQSGRDRDTRPSVLARPATGHLNTLVAVSNSVG